MNSLTVTAQDRSIHMIYDLAGVVAKSSLAAYNLISWSQDFNAGIEAAKVTVLGLAGIGLISQLIRAVGKSRTENYLEAERAKLSIARDNEKHNKESLTFQNEQLLDRVNDANEKLHKQASDLQVERNLVREERLLHKEESDRLLRQLDFFSKQLNEALSILKDEREEKRQLFDQNQELLTRIQRLQKETEAGQIENRSLIHQLEEVNDRKIRVVQQQIDENAAKINAVKES